MSRKIIITAALTGGIQTKLVNPNLPEQPDEIAEAAYECYNEGVSIVHLHARNPQGNPCADLEIYREIHKKIRQKCDVIIQDTTGVGPNVKIEDRLVPLEADPEMASLNMGTMLRLSGSYKGTFAYNPPWEIERYAKAMLDRNIKPEMEVYNPSMFSDVKNLIEKQLLSKPYYINFVIGMRYQGGLDPHPQSLLMLLNALPKLEDVILNVTGIGKIQFPIATLGMLLGTNVRIGMEDNIYYEKGILARSNAQLAARMVRIVRELGFEIASPQEVRELLGIAYKTYQ